MVSMNQNQFFEVDLAPEDALGRPGTLDAPPTWTVSAPGVVNLTISADGLSCTIAGVAPGTVTVTPTATSGGGANSLTGNVIQVAVAATPPQPATQLVETIGPVTDQ